MPLHTRPPKLINQFKHLDNNISTEGLAKVWTAIHRLSIIRKSYPSNEIKRDFFQAMPLLVRIQVVHTGIHYAPPGLLTQELYALFWRNPRSSTQLNGGCVATYQLSHYPSKLDEQDICWAQLEKQGQIYKIYSLIDPYTFKQLCCLTSKKTYYIHQLCVNSEYYLEDLTGAMNNKDKKRERESQKTQCYRHDLMMMVMRITDFCLKVFFHIHI